MRSILHNVLHTYQVFENELEPKHKYRLSYLKDVTIDWVRAYNTEVIWRDERYIPATIEEHLRLSVRSGACHLLSCASFVGMEDIATKESFDWVSSMPKIVHSLCIILRLLDDLKSYDREQMSLHVASTIDSGMKEHNVSMELAQKKIKELIEQSWKNLNEEWLKPNKTQPMELLERIFNLTRTMEFYYKQDDAYTNSYIIKDTINSVFVDSFTVF
uniref:Stc1 n=1 Tax=Arundo donax TaxID=35708 RepID=A0A0A9DV46_ARUDO